MTAGQVPENVLADAQEALVRQNFEATVEIVYSAGLAAGRADERARVAKWLQDMADVDVPGSTLDTTLNNLADSIRRSEHLDD